MTDDLEPTTPMATPEPMPRVTPEATPEPQLDAASGASPAPPVDALPSAPPTPPQPPAGATPAATSGRWRWVVALGAAALVVVAVIAIVLGAGKGSTAAVTTSYLPATTIAYLDARLDLPGDQRDQVAALLSRFPGFADQAALDSKLSDTFDRILRQATSDRYSYSGDVKPWFGGRVAIALTGLPDLGSGASAANAPVIGLISVSDAAKARTELDKLFKDAADAGTRVASSAIDGGTFWTLDPGPTTGPNTSQGHAAVALTDNMIVVGDQDALVKTSVALGRGTGQTLAGSSSFTAAVGALPDARLGTLYVDGAAVKLALAPLASSQPGLDSALGAIPDRVAGSLRVADGAVTIEVRLPKPTGDSFLPVRASTIAERVPGDSLAFVGVNDLGKAIHNLIKTAKTQLGSGSGAQQITALEGILGTSLESYLDWVGDSALVVRVAGGTPSGALVALAADPATAQTRLGQLQAVVALAGLDPAAGVHVATTDHGGTKITELTIDQAGGLRIGWALRDDLFVLGVGEGSVAWVLDATADTSLAKSAGYAAALQAAGAKAGQGILYVDLAGLRSSLEPLIPADSKATYERDVKPWLAPLGAFVSVGYIDGDSFVVREVLSTQPK